MKKVLFAVKPEDASQVELLVRMVLADRYAKTGMPALQFHAGPAWKDGMIRLIMWPLFDDQERPLRDFLEDIEAVREYSITPCLPDDASAMDKFLDADALTREPAESKAETTTPAEEPGASVDDPDRSPVENPPLSGDLLNAEQVEKVKQAMPGYAQQAGRGSRTDAKKDVFVGFMTTDPKDYAGMTPRQAVSKMVRQMFEESGFTGEIPEEAITSAVDQFVKDNGLEGIVNDETKLGPEGLPPRRCDAQVVLEDVGRRLRRRQVSLPVLIEDFARTYRCQLTGQGTVTWPDGSEITLLIDMNDPGFCSIKSGDTRSKAFEFRRRFDKECTTSGRVDPSSVYALIALMGGQFSSTSYAVFPDGSRLNLNKEPADMRPEPAGAWLPDESHGFPAATVRASCAHKEALRKILVETTNLFEWSLARRNPVYANRFLARSIVLTYETLRGDPDMAKELVPHRAVYEQAKSLSE